MDELDELCSKAFTRNRQTKKTLVKVWLKKILKFACVTFRLILSLRSLFELVSLDARLSWPLQKVICLGFFDIIRFVTLSYVNFFKITVVVVWALPKTPTEVLAAIIKLHTFHDLTTKKKWAFDFSNKRFYKSLSYRWHHVRLFCLEKQMASVQLEMMHYVVLIYF